MRAVLPKNFVLSLKLIELLTHCLILSLGGQHFFGTNLHAVYGQLDAVALAADCILH